MIFPAAVDALKAWKQSTSLSKVKALVPLSEMFGYATDVRNKTKGQGTFVMEFKHYEEVPGNIAEGIIKKPGS